MSNGPTIQGIGTHGTDQPNKVFRKFRAAIDIGKGDLLVFSLLDGAYVTQAGASTFVCGVSTEDVKAGGYFKAQVKGFCDYITTDGGVTSGQALVPASSGVCDSAALASATVFAFGVAMADDSSTVLSKAYIDCFGA